MTQPLPVFPDASALTAKVFRNISTIKNSQDLFDDLVDNKEDVHILQAWDNHTSGVNHQKRALERPFQYADTRETLSVFRETQWRTGRFGDGRSYGVWYGALERETSIAETLYWSTQFVREDLAAAKSPIIVDRKMVEAHVVATRVIDWRSYLTDYPCLVDKEDYRFCQALGAHAISQQIDAFLTPSARHQGGCCVPVFNKEVIKRDRTLYFFHFTFFKDGRICMTTDRDTWM